MGVKIRHIIFNKKAALLLFLTPPLFSLSFLFFYKTIHQNSTLTVIVNAKVLKKQTFQLFHSNNGVFSEKESQRVLVNESKGFQKIKFKLSRLDRLKQLRLDFEKNGGNIEIESICIIHDDEVYVLNESKLIKNLFSHNDVTVISEKQLFKLAVKGTDPYIILNFDFTEAQFFLKNLSSSKKAVKYGVIISFLFAFFILFINQKIIVRLSFIFITSILVFGLSYSLFSKLKLNNFKGKVTFSTKVNMPQQFKLYYTKYDRFSEKQSLKKLVKAVKGFQKIQFEIPKIDSLNLLRIDFEHQEGIITIDRLIISDGEYSYEISPSELTKDIILVQDLELYPNDSLLMIKTTGVDPYLRIAYNFEDNYYKMTKHTNWSWPLFYALIISLMFGFWLWQQKWRSYAELNLIKIHIKAYKNNIIFICFFMAILSIPIITQLFFSAPIDDKSEKRTRNSFPLFNYINVFDYPLKYNSYYNDNFGFRQLILKWNSYYKIKLLKVSSIPPKAILGKEDWLFSAEYSDPRYTASNTTYSAKELKKIKLILEDRYHFITKSGAKFYIYFPPIKKSIYPEFLPNSLNINTKTKLDQLVEYFSNHPFITIIDSRKELFLQKKKAQLYFKADTHWNPKGAYIGYKNIMNAINKDFPEIKSITESDLNWGIKKKYDGDISNLLGLKNNWLRNEIEISKKRGWLAKDVSKGYNPYRINVKARTVTMKTSHTKNPKLLMYRDSYCNFLIPLISEHFSTSTYLWTYQITPEIIKKVKPDIVVLEMLEIFIDDLFISVPKDIVQDPKSNLLPENE